MITTDTSQVRADGDEARGSSALGSYRPGLDGLRAVGMTMVLLYHAELGVPGAFLALSQFFTLSGFLITAMLLRSHDRGGIDMGRFWVRRLRRLAPASLVCLLGVAVFGATVATYEQARDLPLQILAAATNVVNWYFVQADQGYIALFADPSPVHHFWSLAVEEQFYLVLSVGLLLLLRRTRDLRILAMVFAVGAIASTVWMSVLYSSGATLDRVYLGTDTRLAELFVGALLAVGVASLRGELAERTRRLVTWLGVGAFGTTIWLWSTVDLAPGRIWQGGMLLFSVASALVILSLLVDRGPLAAVLRLPLVAAYGRITYGVYLFHWPIFLWLTPDRTGLEGWALFAPRFLVTIVAAVLSYHLVEQPIRQGAGLHLPISLRRAAVPVATVLVVVIGFVFVDRDGIDLQATIREDGASLAVPVVPTDGTLDVLAITDDEGAAVVDEIERLGTDDAVRVTRARFGCSSVGEDGLCADWGSEWRTLVDQTNPDVVLLYLEVWPAEDIAALTGIAPDAVDPLTNAAREMLDDGFDQLSARGAPVLFAQPGVAIDVAVRRTIRPFDRAMDLLEASRTDVRRVLELPDGAVIAPEEYREEAAAVILSDLYLYQRADRDRLRRVMVVGDSQARSLGYGLERWAAAEDRAVVWNVAKPGCGLADEGRVPGLLSGQQPVAEDCREVVATLSEKVESFDPELVLVLSSAWDTAPRSLNDAEEPLTMADDELTSYLREEFTAATDVLAAQGATVVWMTAPCVDDVQTGAVGEGFDDERVRILNEEVIAPVVDDRPDVATIYDLGDVLCPGGKALESTDDGVEVRPDGVHFSAESALWFASTHGDDLLSG